MRPDTSRNGRGGDLEITWVGIEDVADIFVDRNLEKAIVTNQVVHVWWVPCSPVLADAQIIEHVLVGLLVADEEDHAWEGRDFVTTHGGQEYHICWNFAIAGGVNHANCDCGVGGGDLRSSAMVGAFLGVSEG